MVSTVDERVFLVAMSRLASNHTGKGCQCAMGYDTIDHRLCLCELHCTLRKELQEKLRAAGLDHDRSIGDILAVRNMVALRLIFECYNDMVLHIYSNAYESSRTHYIPGLIRIYFTL
jgi:hypothetical protein